MPDPTPPDTKMNCEARALLAAEYRAIGYLDTAEQFETHARADLETVPSFAVALRAISTALSEVERLRSALERIAGGQRVHVDGPGQMRFEEYTPREWASQALEGRG